MLTELPTLFFPLHLTLHLQGPVIKFLPTHPVGKTYEPTFVGTNVDVGRTFWSSFHSFSFLNGAWHCTYFDGDTKLPEVWNVARVTSWTLTCLT